MAIHVMQHVLFDNFEADNSILAGMAVALIQTSGKAQAVAANRSTSSHEFWGMAGDDTATSGNTMAIIDPVSPGNYSHSSGDGDDPTLYTGPSPESHPARRLADYMDERGTNVRNWNDVDSNSRATPMRGIAVYRHGGRFKTDQYISDAAVDAAATDGGAAPTFAVNDSLTYGITANAGQFIKIAKANTVQYAGGAAGYGYEVARIVQPGVTSGLLEITLL